MIIADLNEYNIDIPILNVDYELIFALYQIYQCRLYSTKARGRLWCYGTYRLLEIVIYATESINAF